MWYPNPDSCHSFDTDCGKIIVQMAELTPKGGSGISRTDGGAMAEKSADCCAALFITLLREFVARWT